MLIKLDDYTHVAADSIASVKIRSNDDGLEVRMKDGVLHHVPNDYRQSSFTTNRRLVAEVNAALEVHHASESA